MIIESTAFDTLAEISDPLACHEPPVVAAAGTASATAGIVAGSWTTGKEANPKSSTFALAVLILTHGQAEIVEKFLFDRLACVYSLVNYKLVGRSVESFTIFEKAAASRKTRIGAFVVGWSGS